MALGGIRTEPEPQRVNVQGTGQGDDGREHRPRVAEGFEFADRVLGDLAGPLELLLRPPQLLANRAQVDRFHSGGDATSRSGYSVKDVAIS